MPGRGSSTLIVNAGSSSVKFRLCRGDTIVVDGVVDRIGPNAVISFVEGKKYMEQKGALVHAPTYEAASAAILKLAARFEETRSISTIVHRVVHGGTYTQPVVVTPGVLKKLQTLIPLAPLHQPHGLAVIKFLAAKTRARQVVCFDTMFHAKMPVVAKTYALPRAFVMRYGIVRYGFHGLSHASLFDAAKRESGKKYQRAITCQLGNGVSLCAIKNGKSIDTTMGFTPLEGLPMGTRSGNIDPAIVAFLCEKEKKTPQQILQMLEHESGLKALGGASDIRDLLHNEKNGDTKAKFALDFFAYQIKKQIGAYAAILGGLDCIALGGGIARAPEMRIKLLAGLKHLGIVIDSTALKSKAPIRVSKGSVDVWALETDEQEYMFEITKGMRV
jgi:acetate kinase